MIRSVSQLPYTRLSIFAPHTNHGGYRSTRHVSLNIDFISMFNYVKLS